MRKELLTAALILLFCAPFALFPWVGCCPLESCARLEHAWDQGRTWQCRAGLQSRATLQNYRYPGRVTGGHRTLGSHRLGGGIQESIPVQCKDIHIPLQALNQSLLPSVHSFHLYIFFSPSMLSFFWSWSPFFLLLFFLEKQKLLLGLCPIT